MSFRVRSVEFHEEGVQFAFVDVPEDLRDNGMLVNRAIFVPERAMPDELQRLADLAQTTVTEAVYRHSQAKPVRPEEMMDAIHGEGDEEPTSPWDNPEEREVPPSLDDVTPQDTHERYAR